MMSVDNNNAFNVINRDLTWTLLYVITNHIYSVGRHKLPIKNKILLVVIVVKVEIVSEKSHNANQSKS